MKLQKQVLLSYCVVYKDRHDKIEDLLTKAINYLDNSWDQVMAWRNDGRYNIDNSEAERNIRPMTIERSNSKSFGSHEGVESSAVYHTIIATCKAQAISVCEYLKKFFTACVDGRTDYDYGKSQDVPVYRHPRVWGVKIGRLVCYEDMQTYKMAT